MRLLWMSNAPWGGTGYGEQTGQMLPILRDMGHDVACFAYWGLDGGIIDWNGFRIYPPCFDQWGNDAVRQHMRDYEADALVTLYDPFVCDPGIFEPMGWRWFPWVPVDSQGLPSGFDVLENARRIIAMSGFGRHQLIEGGLKEDQVHVIPHGIDCNQHRNRSELERRELRRQFGIPDDAFVVGMVQANKGFRKGIEAQIEAFARFHHDGGGEDAHLYLHVEPTTAMGGVDVDDVLERTNLKGKGIVHQTGEYHLRRGVAPDVMSGIYGCMDVLLQATCAEGFGLPIIEAMANGVPVIVNTGTAMDELTAFPQLICKDPTPFRAPHGGTHFFPNVAEIVEKLQLVHKWSWDRVEEQRNVARMAAESRFDWSVVRRERWEPMMALIEDDVAPKVFMPLADATLKYSIKVGLWTGPDYEADDVRQFVSAAPCQVVLCPPDQVDWSCDAFVVWDEHYWPDDLDRLVTGGKPWAVYCTGYSFVNRRDVHEKAVTMLFDSEQTRCGAEIAGIALDDIPHQVCTGGNVSIWNHFMEALNGAGDLGTS